MWIILGILAIPLIEIALFVTLGAKLGLWLTLAWVLVTGALGIILLKGVAMLGTHEMTSAIREKLQDPRSPMAHQLLVGIAGLLLLLPGFFTDAVGILLLFRPIRSLLIRFLANRITASGVTMTDRVVDGEWQDITPDASTTLGNPPSDGSRH